MPKTKKVNLGQIPDIKMYLVVCGDQTIGNGKAHAALLFNVDAALAEDVQMTKSGYPVKGIFEINTLNIFNKIPYYLK
jgi:hypothetical protein